MSSIIFNRRLELPGYEFYVLLLSYTGAFCVFVLAMTVFVFTPIGLSKQNPDITYIRRAMTLLRINASISVVLTLPMLLINSIPPPPVENPLTSFTTTSTSSSALSSGEAGVATIYGNAEGNGRMSWNFSVVRPIFGLLGLTTCYVVDNHRFFRIVSAGFLIFQVCTESIAAFDVARALRTLQSKCMDSFTGLQVSSDCLTSTTDNYWSEYRLTLLLRRDILASAFLLLSFFLVIFLGVTLGFTTEEYSYSQLHPLYNHERTLWRELNKHGITVSNFKKHVKSGGQARGSLDVKSSKARVGKMQ